MRLFLKSPSYHEDWKVKYLETRKLRYFPRDIRYVLKIHLVLSCRFPDRSRTEVRAEFACQQKRQSSIVGSVAIGATTKASTRSPTDWKRLLRRLYIMQEGSLKIYGSQRVVRHRGAGRGLRSRKASLSTGPVDWPGIAVGLNNDRRWPQDLVDLQGLAFTARPEEGRERRGRFPISNKAEPRPHSANVSLGYDLKRRSLQKHAPP